MCQEVVAVGVEQRGFDVVVQIFELEVITPLDKRRLRLVGASMTSPSVIEKSRMVSLCLESSKMSAPLPQHPCGGQLQAAKDLLPELRQVDLIPGEIR